jgi:hypothetical protein
LILPAGARLQLGWEAAVRGHMRQHPQASGWFRLSLAEPGLAARIEESWADLTASIRGRHRPDQGLLVAAKAWRKRPGASRRLGTRILIGG